MDTKDDDLCAALTLRGCILTQLYALFQEVPLAPVELRQLAESCNTTARELNWNIIYLEKKGWWHCPMTATVRPMPPVMLN